MKAAQEMLLDVGVKPRRVQLEVFTPVGHEPLEIVPKRSLARNLQLTATLVFCIFYLIQSALDWGLPSVTAMQQLDAYRITTGSALMAFISVQWYLPYVRLSRKPAHLATQWHSYAGVLAPFLLYLHSVSLGFAYTFVLSVLFLLNAIVGALDKTLVDNLEQRLLYQRIWLMLHVPSSCLITVLASIHIVYALAYK